MNQIYLYRLHIITLFFLNPPHPFQFQFQLPQNSTDPGRYKWLTFGCMVMEYKGWKLGSTSDSPSAVWSWNTKGEDLAVQVTHLRLYGRGIQRAWTWPMSSCLWGTWLRLPPVADSRSGQQARKDSWKQSVTGTLPTLQTWCFRQAPGPSSRVKQVHSLTSGCHPATKLNSFDVNAL